MLIPVKIIILFFLISSCIQKKREEDSDSPEIKKSNSLLSGECAKKTASQISPMKFRFLGDLSSFEYKPKPEIKTLDYKEGCAITSLKTSLNKDIDYYKWKIFDTKDISERFNNCM